MPENEIKIRVSAQDDGVARVMRKLQDDVSSTTAKIRASSAEMFGPIKPPRFEFKEQLVRDETARAMRTMRDQAARAKLRVEAEVILKDAKGRLFGEGGGPLRDISGRSDEEQAVRDRLARSLREQRAKHGKGGEAGGLLEQLRDATGRGSQLKEITELLEGGGAIAGLTIGGRLLKDWAESAVKLRDALREGIMTSGQVVDQLVRGLPVLGNIFAAGQSIREMFTNEEWAARKITEEAERTNRVIDARKEAIAGVIRATLEMRDLMRGIADEQARDEVDSMAPGKLKELRNAKLQNDQRFDSRVKEIEDKRTGDIDEATAGLRKELADAEARQKGRGAPEIVDANKGGVLGVGHSAEQVAASKAARDKFMQDASADVAKIKKVIADTESGIDKQANAALDTAAEAWEKKGASAEKQFGADWVGAMSGWGAAAGQTFWKNFTDQAAHRGKIDEFLKDAGEKGRRQELADEAAQGNKVAEVELKRQQILDDHKKTQEDLLAILRDQAATEDEKRKARELYSKDVDREEGELKRAGRLGGRAISAIAAQDASSSAFTGASLIEQQTDPIVVALDDQTQKQLDNAKKLAESLFTGKTAQDLQQLLVGALKQIPGLAEALP